jgi:quinol monooxygenase YgiN
MARYRVRSDGVDDVKVAIDEFVEAVAEHEPGTLYEAFVTDDGQSFVHFMSFADPPAELAHQMAEYTERFTQLLYPLCEEKPVFATLTLVESTEG